MPESVTLPGLASMVPLARRAVRTLLEGSPRVDDAELIVSELAGNAVRHSLSSEDGGQFTIVVDRKLGWARLEVRDAGPRPQQPQDLETEDEFGRGLLVVTAVADRWGHDRDPAGSTTWSELGWEEEGR